MTEQEWKEKLTKAAEIDGFKLSSYTDKIIKRIMARNGNCPCRKEDVPCPCEFRFKDIQDTGACHCNLFESKGAK
jgi:ferredoxin-thioredoxin reductase catalytic subunit